MHGNQIWAEMLDVTSAVFADKIISIVIGPFFRTYDIDRLNDVKPQ